MKSNFSKISGWAFLIGVLVALVFGFMGSTNVNVWMGLVVLGIIVGLLNISSAESKNFLMSCAVLIVVSSLGRDALTALPWLINVLNALLVLFVPATIVVATRNAFNMARS